MNKILIISGWKDSEHSSASTIKSIPLWKLTFQRNEVSIWLLCYACGTSRGFRARHGPADKVTGKRLGQKLSWKFIQHKITEVLFQQKNEPDLILLSTTRGLIFHKWWENMTKERQLLLHALHFWKKSSLVRPKSSERTAHFMLEQRNKIHNNLLNKLCWFFTHKKIIGVPMSSAD